MNPNNNQQSNQGAPGMNNPQGAPQQMPSSYTPPVYTQSTSQKIMQETAEAAGTVGVLAGLIATVKGLFGSSAAKTVSSSIKNIKK